MTSIAVFESGRGPEMQKNYGDRFDAASARFISAELRIEHPEATAQATSTIVPCAFFRNSGDLLATVELNVTPREGWLVTTDFNGWGSATAGSWKPGEYRIDCALENRIIASAKFVVTPPADIPAYQGWVRTIRLFEGGSGFPPRDERNYTDRFGPGARFINVELEIDLPPAAKQMGDTSVACTFFKGVIEPVGTVQIWLTPQPGWTSVYNQNGWGHANGGAWPPGDYRVVCSHGGRDIASLPFTVTPPMDLTPTVKFP